MGWCPVGVKFVPSALNDAVQGVLTLLYGDFRFTTKTRDEIIRQRHAKGESLSILAREYGISPQRVFQIVNSKPKDSAS